ncbi:MAG: EamA family transporter [Ornithinibacter sp.]
MALRFAVAALVLAAALPQARRNITRSTLIRGLGLGSLLATGFLLQTCALETTPVATSAFLTGTVVVFAPVIAMVRDGDRLSGRAVGGVLLATTDQARAVRPPGGHCRGRDLE